MNVTAKLLLSLAGMAAIGAASWFLVVRTPERRMPTDAAVFLDVMHIGDILHEEYSSKGYVEQFDSAKPPAWALARDGRGIFGECRELPWRYVTPAAVVGRKFSALRPNSLILEVVGAGSIRTAGFTADGQIVSNDRRRFQSPEKIR